LTYRIFSASSASVQIVEGLKKVTISGFLARDPKSGKVFVPKDGIFVYTDEFNDKMKTKLTNLSKKAKKLEKYRFTTTINVLECFSPTVVGNYTKGFVGLTMAKMINQIKKDERKSGSKSPKSPRSPGSSR
jgi:hypothetical protein